MTFTNLVGRVRAAGGFAQKIFSPSSPNSNALATYAPAEHNVVVALDHATANYPAVLPKGAILKSFALVPTTAFSGGTSPTFSVGNSLGSNDLLAPKDITASAIVAPLNAAVSSNDGQTIYVKINGGPTAGAGFLVISYVPA